MTSLLFAGSSPELKEIEDTQLKSEMLVIG